MKKELDIIGLDCGHCAITLEKYLEKVEGVNSCTINFSTSKLYLDIDDNYKDVIKKIYKTAKEVNPTVKIVDEGVITKKSNVIDITLLIIGMIMGVCAIFIPMLKWLRCFLIFIAVLCMGYKTFYKAIIQLKTFQVNSIYFHRIEIVYNTFLLNRESLDD